MMGNLSAIVAVCDDWGIGSNGGMIVENRADMRHFVRCTKGHTVIMGRKTLDSFPGGRPLADRRNIVLTRDASFARAGVEVVHSVEDALDVIAPNEQAWVIGGAEVYRQFLPCCAYAVVTKNHCVRCADTFFPNLDEDDAWTIASTDDGHEIQPGEGDEGVVYEFVTYTRTTRENHAMSAEAAGAGVADVDEAPAGLANAGARSGDSDAHAFGVVHARGARGSVSAAVEYTVG